MKCTIATCLMLITVFQLRVRADSADSTGTHSDSIASQLQPWRLAAVCTGIAAAVTVSQIRQSSMYWSDPAPFHFNFHDDWQYAHGADKFGHAMAANLLNTGLTEALLWSGVDSTTALWSGFTFALAHQTMIEIRDGFSQGKSGQYVPYLGFSWGDMTANALGASFPLLQHYVPSAVNLRYKYSLHPSAVYEQGGYYKTVTDDYESEYHWLSIPVYDFLGASAKKYWTPYLCIAIGHSVKNLVSAPNVYSFNGHHEWYISLDYNLETLPGNAPWLLWIKRMVNLYHLPAPCVRILPSVVVYGFRL